MKEDSRADLLTPNWNFSQTDCEASSLLSVKARSAKLWENVIIIIISGDHHHALFLDSWSSHHKLFDHIPGVRF